MSPITVKELLALGTNVRVGSEFSPISLKEFAVLAVKNNVHLTIDCSEISPVTAKEIATIGRTNITLIV